ncbi:hypothetical protein CEQ21_08030 (plasmid) [Niallia circulans]|uniref:Uncharacterized protein n=1 Tax=Niallia circulans TaxID=1397 RepID=A0A553SQR0_NIACI|nr:hypothetical protein [Niallia circulans]TRZ39306.1 hypothetical protein CEQ21_08030 [Niallia circulans]
MDKFEELENRIKKMEEEIEQIDRLDNDIFELTQKLEKVTSLLVEMVENNKNIDKNDIDFIVLKFDIDPKKYHELPILVSKKEKEYRKDGTFPTLSQFHQEVIETLSISELEDNVLLPIDVTKNILEKYKKTDDYDYFAVCESILSTE